MPGLAEVPANAISFSASRYRSGPGPGESENLEGGEWELDVIADRNLLSGREAGGVAQLVAHNTDFSLLRRVAPAPNQQTSTTRLVALGTNVALTGISYFQPRLDR